MLGAFLVEGEGRCEVDSSGARERGGPDLSSDFEREVGEEREV